MASLPNFYKETNGSSAAGFDQNSSAVDGRQQTSASKKALAPHAPAPAFGPMSDKMIEYSNMLKRDREQHNKIDDNNLSQH